MPAFRIPDHGVSVVFTWTTLLAALLIAPLSALAEPADVERNEPLEPKVAEASDEAEAGITGIKIPEGWKIQLFAAEPDVANVVAFDVDNRGRVFACETFRQNRGVTDNRGHDEDWLLADLSAKTVQDRIDYHKRLLGDAAVTYAQHDDRIRRLVDSNGDGRVDESSVLAKGFNGLEEGTGAGILVRGNDVYFTCIPKLWKLTDSDDDGKSDSRTALSDGYGVRVAFRGHDMHGLLKGPDGRLYFSIGDRGYHVRLEDGKVLSNPAVGAVFRCEQDGTGLEVYCNGLRNPQELAFNDVGDLFSVDNNSDSGDKARIVHLLEGGDSGWRMYYQYLADRGPFNREKIWHPFHQDQPAYIVPPVANFTDGPSGLAYYPGTGFGDQLKDQFLICDFRGGPSNSGIRSFRLSAEGASYSLKADAQPIWTVLATDVAYAPDGSLLISDWVDGWDGLGKGRIYRLTDPKFSGSDVVREVNELLGGDWTQRSVADLRNDLSHIDRRVRLEAQWQLAERAELESLIQVAGNDSGGEPARLHATWGINHLARIHPDRRNSALVALRGLLDASSPDLQAAATAALGDHGDTKSADTISKLITSDSARVRYFAALSLGKLGHASSFQDVVAMLEKNDNQDPSLRHAGVMFLAQAARSEQVVGLAKHPSESVRRAAVVALRRQSSGQVAEFLKDSSELVVAEASRAIHDAPIPVATEDLAALVDQELADEELIRRVLNANFRLGTQEAAKAVAQFAAQTTAPEPMRMESLDMLLSWSKPDPRDRVLNDYRPLGDRDEAIGKLAVGSVLDQLMKEDGDVREKAIDVASTLGLREIVPMLIKRVSNLDAKMGTRATALTALARLSPKEAVAAAKEIKITPATRMVTAGLRVLAEHDFENALPKFIQATTSSNSDVRQVAWDILAASDDDSAVRAIENATNQFLDGKLPGDVHINVLEAGEGKLSTATQDRLDQFMAKRDHEDPLGPWLVSLQGGDVEKGKEQFFGRTELSCVRCHKVDRAGGEVGPNLTVIGKTRDRRYLLESICIPNAQIAKGFETAIVVDADGQVINGIVKNETDDVLELVEADGTQREIFQDDIVARKKGQSSMPADLVKQLTPRELRDLVEYLASLQVDPRAADEVE
ncbi:MAG: PVC-type heme-binding CxxCH protein [Planctomycetota bacterium]